MALKIFIVGTFIILCMSFFCGIAGLGSFSEDIGSSPDAPGVWDILSFVGGGYWALLTFSIEGLLAWLCLLFWFIQIVWTYAFIALIRGVS